MTFKHKLSCRLALLKDRTMVVSTALLAVAAIGGCERSLSFTDPATGMVTRLVISPKILTLRQNQVADFTAVGLAATGDTATVAVSWSVTSGSITDTSTSNGKHYGRYKAASDTGKVKVTATGHPGGSDTAVVTVTPVPVASVTVTPTSASAQVGQTVQLSATTQDSTGAVLTGRAVSWSSSNLSVASVNGSGLVTGLAAGATTVTATSEGQGGTSSITVSSVPVASVAVIPTSATIQVGQTQQLAATLKDASGNTLSGRVVSWSSSNPSVATVSGSGVVTAAAVGSAIITATSEGQTGTSSITITNVPVASVAVTPTSAGIQVGQTVQLTATPQDGSGSPLSGRAVTWASSNGLVATVSGSGLVTAAAVGSATITATSEGQGGTSSITVSNVPV
ncbi:MAG: Ig domain-containing protein, partial [Candidatus Eisenbacteria bacterium]